MKTHLESPTTLRPACGEHSVCAGTALALPPSASTQEGAVWACRRVLVGSLLETSGRRTAIADCEVKPRARAERSSSSPSKRSQPRSKTTGEVEDKAYRSSPTSGRRNGLWRSAGVRFANAPDVSKQSVRAVELDGRRNRRLRSPASSAVPSQAHNLQVSGSHSAADSAWRAP